jgi:DNA-binding IclR family transcriptional regulator
MSLPAIQDVSAVSVLDRAFDLLKVFSHRDSALTLSDIAARTGMPKSTAHRVLRQLGEVGAVERHGNQYRVGLAVFALGSLSEEAQLRESVLPHLHELHRLSSQTVHLAVLRGSSVVYLAKLRSVRSVATPCAVGSEFPAHATAVGKAILARSPAHVVGNVLSSPLAALTPKTGVNPEHLRAELQVVDSAGIAWDFEGSQVGLACVAAPIMVGSQVSAAVSLCYPSSVRCPRELVGVLREVCKRASARASELTWQRG